MKYGHPDDFFRCSDARTPRGHTWDQPRCPKPLSGGAPPPKASILGILDQPSSPENLRMLEIELEIGEDGKTLQEDRVFS